MEALSGDAAPPETPGLRMSTPRSAQGMEALRTAQAAGAALTLMLLRLTSSSALSLAWICRSVSSTLVGFGGSSGTGLYLSGFTTPGHGGDRDVCEGRGSVGGGGR